MEAARRWAPSAILRMVPLPVPGRISSPFPPPSPRAPTSARLARDIAYALGTVGHVSYLRRTRAGPFSLEQAISLDFLQTAAKARQLDGAVVPLIAALDDIPALPVTPDQAQLLRHGQKLGGFPAPPGLCTGDRGRVSGRSGGSFGRRPPGRPGVQPFKTNRSATDVDYHRAQGSADQGARARQVRHRLTRGPSRDPDGTHPAT